MSRTPRNRTRTFFGYLIYTDGVAERGSYAKGVAKREEILEAAVGLVGRNGFSGATVRELADAVGLSPNGLLHYFGSKDELFTEILRRRDEVDVGRESFSGNPRELMEATLRGVGHNAGVPGLVQMYSRISNEAARTDHPSHEYFRQRYEAARDTFADVFGRLQDEGRLAAEADPRRLAALFIALLDGLQTQWMYDNSIDMADHATHLLDLLGVWKSS